MQVRDQIDISVFEENLASLPKLGVGLLYNPSLPDFLKDNMGSWDYLEIIPDMFWTEERESGDTKYVEMGSWVEMLQWFAEKHPIVAHNLGLSLGSSESFEMCYLDQLNEWHKRFNFKWHSDHLSFVKVVGASGHDQNAGLAVPVPYDYEILDMIVDRIRKVQNQIKKTFLIENNVYYIDFPDQDMSEPEFLNQLSYRSGCGLLLDIHNVYVNARNHGFKARDFLDNLDLSRVIEIHVAGGSEISGVYTDSHAGPCPEEVWELLEYTAPTTKNLCGITFEFHESYYPLLKEEGILTQLNRARRIWDLCKLNW